MTSFRKVEIKWAESGIEGRFDMFWKFIRKYLQFSPIFIKMDIYWLTVNSSINIKVGLCVPSSVSLISLFTVSIWHSNLKINYMIIPPLTAVCFPFPTGFPPDMWRGAAPDLTLWGIMNCWNVDCSLTLCGSVWSLCLHSSNLGQLN